ncbi:MAG: CAP domain-containing protein [Haliea sp.]|nr:MAG: CAP domain-containing protein [Haliea sp.]
MARSLVCMAAAALAASATGLAMAQTVAPPAPDHLPLLRALNAARAAGCDRKPGVAQGLQASAQLSGVAQRIAGGSSLSQAMQAADYKPTVAGTLFLDGYTGPTGVAQGAQRHSCQAVINPQFMQAGFYQRGVQTWIVLAAPLIPPGTAAGGDAGVQSDVLRLVNAARARERRCGDKLAAAAPPLAMNSQLQAAALAHADDMARHDYFEHAGRDGATAAERASRAGYAWRTIGENIAAGQADAATVVASWLKSPGHCVNLMSPRFREMGVAFAVNRQSRAGIYWAQVFGASRAR